MVGAAFSDTKKTVANRNVIVFVKPHIIQDPRTYSTITRNQEELYGSKKQSNQEDFNAGLELIRSSDDADDYEND
jgi:type II secretory pathway component GspD/PulD (secretin)